GLGGFFALSDGGGLGAFFFGGFAFFFIVDDVDAHLIELGHDVFDRLRIELVAGQNLVELFVCDEAARLGGLDHLLHPGVGKVEDRALRGFFLFRRLLFSGGLAHGAPKSAAGCGASSSFSFTSRARASMSRASRLRAWNRANAASSPRPACARSSSNS